MIEETVMNYLRTQLQVDVLMELPEVPSEDYPIFPAELVTIERVGGSVTNRVNAASLAIQSHAQSLYGAAALDERVREAMDGIVALPEIGGVRLSSNYNHTDTRTKRYRYQSVFDIYYV